MEWSLFLMCVVEQFGASSCFYWREKERERCANHRAMPLLPLLPRLSPCVGQGLLWASCFCWKKLVWHAKAEPWTPVVAALRERESWFELQCCYFYTFLRRSFGWHQNQAAVLFSAYSLLTVSFSLPSYIPRIYIIYCCKDLYIRIKFVHKTGILTSYMVATYFLSWNWTQSCLHYVNTSTVHVNIATLREALLSLSAGRNASHSFLSLSGLMETETLLDLMVSVLEHCNMLVVWGSACFWNENFPEPWSWV